MHLLCYINTIIISSSSIGGPLIAIVVVIIVVSVMILLSCSDDILFHLTNSAQGRLLAYDLRNSWRVAVSFLLAAVTGWLYPWYPDTQWDWFYSLIPVCGAHLPQLSVAPERALGHNGPIVPLAKSEKNLTCERVYNVTRNILDCDQFNVLLVHIIFFCIFVKTFLFLSACIRNPASNWDPFNIIPIVTGIEVVIGNCLGS